ncbi:hypothetical protein BDW69DRAFT_26145 [Aspergillus filifer]
MPQLPPQLLAAFCSLANWQSPFLHRVNLHSPCQLKMRSINHSSVKAQSKKHAGSVIHRAKALITSVALLMSIVSSLAQSGKLLKWYLN